MFNIRRFNMSLIQICIFNMGLLLFKINIYNMCIIALVDQLPLLPKIEFSPENYVCICKCGSETA